MVTVSRSTPRAGSHVSKFPAHSSLAPFSSSITASPGVYSCWCLASPAFLEIGTVIGDGLF
jgi:hypothetical protein